MDVIEMTKREYPLFRVSFELTFARTNHTFQYKYNHFGTTPEE